MRVKLTKDLEGRKVGDVIDAANGDELVKLGYAEPVLLAADDAGKKDQDAAIQKAVADGIAAAMKKDEPKPPALLDAEAITKHEYRGIFPDRKTAHLFGSCVLAVAGNQKAATHIADIGLSVKALNEGVGSTGQNLVAEVFTPSVISLFDKYGIFPRVARNIPMSSDSQSWPVMSADATAYFPGESGTITASDITLGAAKLVTNKLAALQVISSELGEDAQIAVGELVAESHARQFSKKIDQCGFIGTGTSTYGGIRGITQRLIDLGTIANTQGLVVASGNTFAEFVIGDFEKMVGTLPDFAEGPGARWYMHKYFYFTVPYTLAMALGGVTATEAITGAIAGQVKFLGYPVEFVSIMPKADSNSQVAALLGDVAQAAFYGNRRSFTLEQSRDAYFTTDQIGIRSTQRFAINVHSVGNNTATAASKQAGPVIGLISAAS